MKKEMTTTVDDYIIEDTQGIIVYSTVIGGLEMTISEETAPQETVEDMPLDHLLESAPAPEADDPASDDQPTPPLPMTLADVRLMGITGAELTRDQMTALRKEAYSKLHATGELEKDFTALKEKYIKKHNSTGVSPENRKFRPIWDFGSRDQICRYTWGGKREKLLALWDEREGCRYEDQYTRYLDVLIETAGDLYTEDLALYNSISAEYDKKMMADYKAKMEARKARAKEV